MSSFWGRAWDATSHTYEEEIVLQEDEQEEEEGEEEEYEEEEEDSSEQPSGYLLGRLNRFMGNATTMEEVQEDEGDGDGGEEPSMVEEEPTQSLVGSLAGRLMAAVAPPPSSSHAEDEDDEQNGWEDDLEGLDEDEDGWEEDDIDFPTESELPVTQQQPLPLPPPVNTSENGWEEEDGLEDIDVEGEVSPVANGMVTPQLDSKMESITTPIAQNTSILLSEEQEEPALQEEDGGWDDDDLLDDIDISETNAPQRVETKVSFPLPTLPPPNETVQDETNEKEQEDGWGDNDEGLLDDLVDDHDDHEATQIDQVPPQPKDAQTNNVESAAIDAAEGWGDDVDLDVSGEAATIAASSHNRHVENSWEEDIDDVNDVDDPTVVIAPQALHQELLEDQLDDMEERAEEEQGWDNDDDDIDGLLEDQEEAAPNQPAAQPVQVEVAAAAPPAAAAAVAQNNNPVSPSSFQASPLVDYVPLDHPITSQRDSTMANASDQSGTQMNDDTIGEPDEQDFGPMVDHLPPGQAAATLLNTSRGASSVLAMAAPEEIENDDDEVGEDTAPGETSEEPGVQRVPPVVDHVPSNIAGVRGLRDSTIAVASEQSMTVMEDIWKEDFDPDDVDYGPVVDHTPAPRASLLSLRSLSIQAVIAEQDEEEEDDEGQRFAHARQSVGVSAASVADSMAVFAPIAEQDGENTVERSVENDDETSQATPTVGALSIENGEALVDHVPVRREGRPTDSATLLVLADPSEVSTVGDMTYEEMQYGPVVDQTPPPRPARLPSVAGSTIVAATKSECLEDLEDDDDLDGGDQATTIAGDDGATFETSLGGPEDDHNRQVQEGEAKEEEKDEDNVVDFVPGTPGLRRVNSSSAIAEAQSVISTREDEFGLVVDQTPLNSTPGAPQSGVSVAALATLSEAETLKSEDVHSTLETQPLKKIELDNVPLPSEHSIKPDSIAALKSVTSEGDSLDETVYETYGPVVDQLPSIPPSRGGSTTGALATLATLSEAGYDETVDGGEDGWESDDQALSDILSPPGGAAKGEADPQTPEMKNKSVTFQTIDSMSLPPPAVAPPTGKANPTAVADAFRNAAASPVRSFLSEETYECHACNDVSSLDCPCIQRVLATAGDQKAVMATRRTPEGIPVEVDYNKLLQEEVTKRLLLEKEVDRYRDLVDSLRKKSSSVDEIRDRAMSEIRVLQEANSKLSNQLGSASEKSAMEEAAISKLEGDLVFAHNSMSELENENKKVASEVATLRAEHDAAQQTITQLEEDSTSIKAERELLEQQIAQLRDAAQQREQQRRDAEEASRSEIETLQAERERLLSAQSENTRRVSDLETIVSSAQENEERLRGANEKLSNEKSELLQETEKSNTLLADAKSENERITRELEAASSEAELEAKRAEVLECEKNQLVASMRQLESDVARLEGVAGELEAHRTRDQEEIARLGHLVADSANADEVEAHFTQKIQLLESDVSKKAAENSRLEQQLRENASKAEDSEAKILSQLRESTRQSKQHESEIHRLIGELQMIEQIHEKELAKRDDIAQEMTNQLEERAQHNAALSTELDDAVAKIASLESAAGATESLKDDEIVELHNKISILEKAEKDLRVSVAEKDQRLESLSQMEGDRSILEDKLLESHDRIEDLERQVQNFIGSEETMKKRLAELRDLNGKLSETERERDTLQETLIKNHDKMEDMQRQLDTITAEKAGLFDVELQLSFVQKDRDRLNQTISEQEKKMKEQERQVDEASDKLRASDSRADLLSQELETLKNNNAELSESHQSNLVALNQKEEIIAELHKTLEELSNEVQLVSQKKEELGGATQQLMEQEEIIVALKHENDALNEQHSALVTAHDNMSRDCDDLHAQLRQHRDDLAELNAMEGKLRNDVESLVQEREMLIQERTDIAEDNEDLLIQLALAKEQLEAGESGVAGFRDELADRESRLSAAEAELSRLRAANEELGARQNSNKDDQAEIEYLRRAMDDLAGQRHALEEELRALATISNTKDEQISELAAQQEELVGRLQDAESASAAASSNLQNNEGLHSHRVNDLEQELGRLDGICKGQHGEIERLGAALGHAEAAIHRSNDESRLLRDQMVHLEQNRDEVLRQKDAAIDQLHAQVDRLRSEGVQSDQQVVAEMSEQLAELQNRLRASEQQSLGRLQELERVYEGSRHELAETSHRLKLAEEALMRNEAMAREALAQQTAESDRAMQAKEEIIEQLRRETQELVGRTSQLEERAEADGKKLNELGTLKEELRKKEGELEVLESQLSDLSSRLSSAEETRQQDQEAASSEIESLKESVSQKNGSIRGLENQLKSLSFELVEQRKALTRKEEELTRVSLDLEEIRAEQLETTQRVAAQVLDAEVSWSEAESTDHMRGLIISLSQALENSECQRAEAIDRLLKERKANADSLKRLGESVKRFYSTLTLSSP